jgi:glucose/arabinose dehydrogenase
VRTFGKPIAAVVLLALAFAWATPAAHAAGLLPAAGFTIEQIGVVPHARELAITPSGDLVVGTLTPVVYLLSNAEGHPRPPVAIVTLPDEKAAGVAVGADAIYVGTTSGVWKIPYAAGRVPQGVSAQIARVRTEGTGGHSTTSVAVSPRGVYVSVGSSCNACVEHDPTRASILRVTAQGLVRAASRIRNAIALAVDPENGDLWAGVAGQDELAHGHPFEMFDDVDAHGGVPDYGWPDCYEDRVPVAQADCSHVAVSQGIFPGYETPIGAVFYPTSLRGRYAFPAAWRGGAYVTLHGSWHTPRVPPRVVFIPIRGRAPTIRVDWRDPSAQWQSFVEGYQDAAGTRVGRPTGVAVGPQGSLFVADDLTGAIYRIRPNT